MQALILTVVLFCATVVFFTLRNQRLANKGAAAEEQKKKSRTLKAVEEGLILQLAVERNVKPETLSRDSQISYNEVCFAILAAMHRHRTNLVISGAQKLVTVGQLAEVIQKQLDRSIRDRS